MKRKIVVADRDESLQYAFATIFSKEHYQILYTANGKEVEKIAEKMKPDVYIVNINLPKANGIDVYKKLQKQRFLEAASFFFLKDEDDTTQLLGYQVDGVIEKPINFFRVYETITKEDDVIDLTDVVEDEKDGPKRATVEDEKERPRRQIKEVLMGDIQAALGRNSGKKEEPAAGRKETTDRETPTRNQHEKTAKGETVKEQRKEEARGGEPTFEERVGERLKDVMGSMTEVSSSVPLVAETDAAIPDVEEESRAELEVQFKKVLQQAMEEAAVKLSARLAPVLTQYVEDYVKRMLLEVAEKAVRDEIDKLLKESAE